MDLRLHDKKAFVSGSSRGIGYAIAAALAAEGAEVVLNGRDPSAVDAALARLREEHPGARVSAITADVASVAEVDELVRAVGEVDILVNNVGMFGLAEFTTIPDDEWARYFEVNVMSGVRLSRALLPRMLERGWGRVIFISSESGVNVPADMLHYGMTKAAMIALGNGLSKLTRGTSVTVNTVLGGPTFSDGVAASVEAVAQAQALPAEAMKAAIIGQNRTTLLERFIEPDEIASLVAYVASPLASATNGAALRVDGGVLTGLL
jgi:NAD(P)-dependent dehydrogenase (short-subunit alcohol dehydrogenase family)